MTQNIFVFFNKTLKTKIDKNDVKILYTNIITLLTQSIAVFRTYFIFNQNHNISLFQ